MSEERSKSKLAFIEIAAILLFVVGIIMIFVSRSGVPDRDRELRNAVRYQDVSEIADAMWRLSLSSPDFVASLRSQAVDNSVCSQDSVSIVSLENFLVPEYFEQLPKDPTEESYRFSVDTKSRITVCTSFGENEDGGTRTISITR
jgi:hypothetical protein